VFLAYKDHTVICYFINYLNTKLNYVMQIQYKKKEKKTKLIRLLNPERRYLWSKKMYLKKGSQIITIDAPITIIIIMLSK